MTLAIIFDENGQKQELLTNICPEIQSILDTFLENYCKNLTKTRFLLICQKALMLRNSVNWRSQVERLGVKAEESIFIDDRVDYIEGTRLAGLNTILFKSPGQAKEALRSFLVKI